MSHSERPQTGLYRGGLKRGLDMALVVLTLPIIALVVFSLAAIIFLRDRHNPFYCQNRIGRGGRIYRIWKLRTMIPDADRHLSDHLKRDPAALAEWTATQKLKADPRITAFGRFLRKSSLDELPQLWNVLKGDMSLVGPRPMMTCQRDLYPGTDYYDLRPGITGPWQVSSRNDTTFADRARFDAAYNREISFVTDIRLLLATVRVVLRATGH